MENVYYRVIVTVDKVTETKDDAHGCLISKELGRETVYAETVSSALIKGIRQIKRSVGNG